MPKTLTLPSGVLALLMMTAQPTGATPIVGQLGNGTAAHAALAQKAHYGRGYDGYRSYRGYRPYHGYYRSYYADSYRGYDYYPPYWYYRGGDWCRAWQHECAKRWGWGGRHYRHCLWRHDC